MVRRDGLAPEFPGSIPRGTQPGEDNSVASETSGGITNVKRLLKYRD
jgi:hypothetical protein